MIYQKEIDGLRAISVLGVIFFHLNSSLLSGGYIGVDIFFVISGYLISKIIIEQIQKNEFSFLIFFSRRAYRLFPALSVVLITTLIAGFFLYDHVIFKNLYLSIIACITFTSNLYFWKVGGYFGLSSNFTPLLHTWTLSLEEQVYFFLPISLFLLKNNKWWLTSILLASFMLSVYCIYKYPSATFYLLPTRIWEFLTGSILASSAFVKKISEQAFLHFRCRFRFEVDFGLIGLSLILSHFIFLNKNSLFPAQGVLIPVLGVLLILSNPKENAISYKLLTSPGLMFIGKISYSLYLWHFPVIALWAYFFMRPIGLIDSIVLLGIIFFLSITTWYFIEILFRKKKGTSVWFYIAPFFLLPTIFVFSYILFVTKNLTLFNEPNKTINTKNDKEYNYWLGQHNSSLNRVSSNSIQPSIGYLVKKPSFVLWGDSHAMAIAPALEEVARKQKKSGFLFSASGIPPLFDVGRSDNKNMQHSTSIFFEYIIANKDIKTVVLASNWVSYYFGKNLSLKNEIDSITLTFDQNINKSLIMSNKQIFKLGFEKTIKKLKHFDKKIIIINQIPELKYNIHFFYLVNLKRKFNISIRDSLSQTVEEYVLRTKELNIFLNEISVTYDVKIVKPISGLSSGIYCNYTDGENLLYTDDNHLSVPGAKKIKGFSNIIF